MPKSELGQLSFVDLREAWPDEARDFTPWLATDGLRLLGTTIEAELILVSKEASVGSFSADILAQLEGEDEHFVVVENQLERTNHDHLGKIITYASGLKAKTIIWVAKEFTEEHRQALDWLNEQMEGHVSFFGFEIQLLRIGTSAPAPQFRMVSSPNTWAASMQQVQRAELTETKKDQQIYWQELADYMRAKNTFLSLKKPRPQHWYEIAIGRSSFQISLTLNSRLNQGACELYIAGPQAKQTFDMLVTQKNVIETELGIQLTWQRLDHRVACRILTTQAGSIYESQQRQFLKEWMHRTAEQFHRVFSSRVAGIVIEESD